MRKILRARKNLRKLLWNFKENVDNAIIKNDLIFDIDWQGTKQLSKFKNLKLVKDLFNHA